VRSTESVEGGGGGKSWCRARRPDAAAGTRLQTTRLEFGVWRSDLGLGACSDGLMDTFSTRAQGQSRNACSWASQDCCYLLRIVRLRNRLNGLSNPNREWLGVHSDAVFLGLLGPPSLSPPLYVSYISLKNIYPLARPLHASRCRTAVRPSHSAFAAIAIFPHTPHHVMFASRSCSSCTPTCSSRSLLS
jgi:hypothetical protein